MACQMDPVPEEPEPTRSLREANCAEAELRRPGAGITYLGTVLYGIFGYHSEVYARGSTAIPSKFFTNSIGTYKISINGEYKI